MEGRAGLVTGAGSGIGRATAVALGSDGAYVAVADVDEPAGHETVELVRAAGGEADFVRCDVAREDEVHALVADIAERRGRLDFAHNNAGVPASGHRIDTLPEADWDRVIGVNLKGVWLCLKHELQVMRPQGSGAIVNTSSSVGFMAAPDSSPYNTSKHGVLGLTKEAAIETAALGIRVNAVCPGFVQTPMADGIPPRRWPGARAPGAGAAGVLAGGGRRGRRLAALRRRLLRHRRGPRHRRRPDVEHRRAARGGALMRLHIFDGGSTDLPLRNFRLGWPGDDRVTAPTPWYFIEHPRGNVVIDGGNAPQVAVDPVAHWGEIAKSSITTMRPDQAVVPAMRARGFDPADVRWIVQSHLHIDHTGALAVIEEFPNAEVLVTRTEHAWAHAPAPFAEWGYCRADFVKPGIPWSLLEDQEDGYDLFGDGTLVCWRTPGHSPGHLSFEVHLPSGAAIFLAIDAVNRLDELDGSYVPAFTTSLTEATASIARVRRLAWRAGAEVIAGHDPDQWRTLRRAPEFYE